jgi:hypothetical protein
MKSSECRMWRESWIVVCVYEKSEDENSRSRGILIVCTDREL